MRKRFLLATGAIGLAVCTALLAMAMFSPRHGVTKANFDRIEVGMTLEAAKQIIGVDATKETTFANGAKLVMWFEDDDFHADMMLTVFEDGKVTIKEWSWSTETTLQRRFRRWLQA